MVRGDHEVNEVRLQNIYGAINVGMASDEDLERVGLTAGYISPIGLKRTKDFDIICDATVMEMQDACCGANEKDKHYIHVNPKRDFGDVRVDTIRQIDANDVCPECGGEIVLTKGIEVGQVFKLGTKYSEKLGATYLDSNGKSHPMVMGCYGIGVTRTVAASIEQNHDDDGIIWPVAIAPYEVVIVPANNKSEEVMGAAKELYDEMEDKADEVVLDDRNERAGIKFKDADLIGYPVRVTIGKKWQQTGNVEIRLRRTGEVIEVPLEECHDKVMEILKDLHEKNL
jgi:prolyl-tRNA synthetase